MTAPHHLRAVRRLAPLAALLVAASCASSDDSLAQMRSQSVRPERQTPTELVEMREEMAEMRTDTLERLDRVMGAAPEDTGAWYTPAFDALDFAVGWTRLLW